MHLANAFPLGPWFVLLSFIAFLVINGSLWIARRHKTATTGSRRAQLLAEIAFLRREAAKLNNPSTYARCAKYQRLANVKDKEHAELTAGPAVPELADGLLLLGRAVKVLVLCTTTLALWEVPVAQVMPRTVAVPLTRLLAFPRGAEFMAFGGVAVTPWLLLVDMATEALVRVAFPPLRTVAAAAEAALNAVAVERLAREAETTGRSRSLQQVQQGATVSLP